MFSRTKDTDSTPAAQPAPQSTKRAQRANAPSIISADLTVKGNLVSAGDVQVDGRVEGDVRAGALVVGEKAVIQGDVYAEDAIVRGRVDGTIRARKVQLCSTAHVEGNILHEALAVEAGAFFEGNCRHSDNPLGDIVEAPRKVATAAPAPAQPRPVMPAPIVQSSGQSAMAIKADDIRPAPARAATASFTPLKG